MYLPQYHMAHKSLNQVLRDFILLSFIPIYKSTLHKLRRFFVYYESFNFVYILYIYIYYRIVKVISLQTVLTWIQIFSFIKLHVSDIDNIFYCLNRIKGQNKVLILKS